MVIKIEDGKQMIVIMISLFLCYRFGQLQAVNLESVEPSLRAGMLKAITWLLNFL